MTRILITGSRTWEDPDTIAKVLYDYIRETESTKVAEKAGIPVRIFRS